MNGSHARSTEWGSTNRARSVRVVCPACGNVKHRRFSENKVGGYGWCNTAGCGRLMVASALPKKLKDGKGR